MSIPFRQIHMDFHTSEQIDGIGERFNAEEFAATLKAAKVNSINIFAKCHHGMYYYPTKIGSMHPHLKFDLFGEQMKILKENNIRAIAYTCVVWNEDWANRHPEWLTVDYNGLAGGKKPFDCDHYQWRNLCLNNPDYLAVIKAEIDEIYKLYKPQGFWLDIILAKDCVCTHCQKEMQTLGLDSTVYADVKRFGAIVEIKYCEEVYRYIKAIDPSLEVYFNNHPYALENAEDIAVSSVTKRKYFDFIDIESLPSEQWGYTHFPVSANYVNKYDKEICMMNGKFHTAWGDFGSLRHRTALEYECFRALANGARICVGDQLHPSGEIDKVVYQRIGEVFSQVERLERYVDGAEKIREVCVLIPTDPKTLDALNLGAVEGAVYRVLSELHIPFDFVNCVDSFDGYKLMILPDNAAISKTTAQRINEFVKKGGKLLVTGSSGITDGRFIIDAIPTEFVAMSEFDSEYISLNNDCFADIPPMPHVLYRPGVRVKSKGNVLANMVDPYFARNYKHFCSHRQAPPTLYNSEHPAIVESDNCIYIASPLFTNYGDYGYTVHRDIIKDCINLILDSPLIKTDLPSITETTLWKQEDGMLLHMLNYVVQKKAHVIDTVEDVYMVVDKYISVKTDFNPSSVVKLPQKNPVEFSHEGGYTTIKIDCEQGYTLYQIKE